VEWITSLPKGLTHDEIVDKRIHRAIEPVTLFKAQSGEPWSTVGDVDGLLMTSKHFAAIAKNLPDWDLDKLGKALNLRDAIRSGCRMDNRQHYTVRELDDTLMESALSNNEDAFSYAAYFYVEIGFLPVATEPLT
jgi:hypothetical protein